MFKAYESKPATRMAFQIAPDHIITKCDGEASYTINVGTYNINFKAHQTPVVGDYIARLTEDDTYHVGRDVFRERNIVPETDA